MIQLANDQHVQTVTPTNSHNQHALLSAVLCQKSETPNPVFQSSECMETPYEK